jgi:hypothetical protein
VNVAVVAGFSKRQGFLGSLSSAARGQQRDEMGQAALSSNEVGKRTISWTKLGGQHQPQCLTRALTAPCSYFQLQEVLFLSAVPDLQSPNPIPSDRQTDEGGEENTGKLLSIYPSLA